VWADVGLPEKKHVGTCTINIKDLDKIAKPDKQKTFRDKVTRKDISFYARELKIKDKKIVSAYVGLNEGNNATIEFAMWFQKELPYPDLDLNALKQVTPPMNSNEQINNKLGKSP